MGSTDTKTEIKGLLPEQLEDVLSKHGFKRFRGRQMGLEQFRLHVAVGEFRQRSPGTQLISMLPSNSVLAPFDFEKEIVPWQ